MIPGCLTRGVRRSSGGRRAKLQSCAADGLSAGPVRPDERRGCRMLIDEIQGREDEDEDGDDAEQSRNPPFSGFLHGQDFEFLASAGAPEGAPVVTAAGAFGTDTV